MMRQLLSGVDCVGYSANGDFDVRDTADIGSVR